MWCNHPFSQGRQQKEGVLNVYVCVLIKIFKKGGKQYIYRVGVYEKIISPKVRLK